MSDLADRTANNTAAPDTVECTTPADTEVEAEVFFNPTETKSIIDHGISAAMQEFQKLYEKKLAALNARLEASEARNTELQQRLDTTISVNKKQMEATDSRVKYLERCVEKLEEQSKCQEKDINDLEQYSRRSHIRIRGLQVGRNADFKTAVAHFCTTRLQVPITAEDLDAAHPLPIRRQPTQTTQTVPKQASSQSPNSVSTAPTPAPIIVRFHRRDQRDAVIRARSKLSGQGIVVTEDLTSANQKLLLRLYASKAIDNAWSWKGKILATKKGSKKINRYDIHDDIPE